MFSTLSAKKSVRFDNIINKEVGIIWLSKQNVYPVTRVLHFLSTWGGPIKTYVIIIPLTLTFRSAFMELKLDETGVKNDNYTKMGIVIKRLYISERWIGKKNKHTRTTGNILKKKRNEGRLVWWCNKTL